MADGYAVKELLKLTSLLYEAMKTKVENDLDLEEDSPMGHNFDISSKVKCFLCIMYLSLVHKNKKKFQVKHLKKLLIYLLAS